jgi:glucose/mannose-6-phosphate isomerase
MMIWSILKMAAVLPINPIFEVFSRRCGVSEMTDGGMAIACFLVSMFSRSFCGENLAGCVELKSCGSNIKVRVVVSEMADSVLDDVSKIKGIDKSGMLSFCVDVAEHYGRALEAAGRVSLGFSVPDNVVVAGMGGSAIGGELLKDLVREDAAVPVEVSRAYSLPGYVDERSLVLVVSYSGETEETLSSFLDAVKRKCMVFCVSSGGRLLEFAERLGVPFLRVPSGFPPRAALPYLFAPLVVLSERLGVVSGVSGGFSEAMSVLERVSGECAPEVSVSNNVAKSLAVGVNGSVPVVYGFGVFRGVAQRFKTQFNENAKVPSKWEYFSEVDHNEVVGWERAGSLAECFSSIFIRDKAEPVEFRNRIEITKGLMPSGSKLFEVWGQGEGVLARMLSAVCIGDFASVYLALLRGVDPTPVETISLLKARMQRSGTKEKVVRELERLAGSR